MKNVSRLLACLLPCVIAGCSDNATAPRGTPADVTGSWGEQFSPTIFPGNSFLLSLQDSGDLVSGSGSYAGEAGPYGALVVSGTAAGDSVHLQVIYVPNATTFPLLPPDTAHFSGVLTTRDRMDGTLVRGGSATMPFTLARLPIVVDPI